MKIENAISRQYVLKSSISLSPRRGLLLSLGSIRYMCVPLPQAHSPGQAQKPNGEDARHGPDYEIWVAGGASVWRLHGQRLLQLMTEERGEGHGSRVGSCDGC